MLYFKKNTFFRKIKVDGCTIAHISVEDHRPQEISEKEFHETRKDDRAKPLHIMLDTEHGARVLGRHALHWDAGNAIELLFRLCDLCQEPRSVLVMMLLCLMAPLYDTLYPLIGSLACNMSGITATPPVLQAELAAFAGDECWEGKHWKVYIPHIWTPKVPLGGFSPSTDLRDYAELRIQWQEMTIRLAAPCRNRLLVLEAGVPASIRKQIRKAAPLGIPVMLGKQSGSDATYCLTLDGIAYYTYDEKILSALQKLSDAISALVIRFGDEQKKESANFLQRIREHRTRFLPVKLVGDYVQMECKAEAEIMSTLLAVLQEFLQWLITSQKCSYDAANIFFRRVWADILPESAPKKVVSTKRAGTRVRLEDAAGFFRFLADFLAEHLSDIRRLGENWKPHTIAVLRTVGTIPEPLLIFEREPLFAAYRSWLTERDGDVSFADSVKPELLPAKLQNALTQAGIPFKNGGRDVTWKYAFFPNSVSATKAACLGLPVNELLTLWKQYEIEIVDEVGQLLRPETNSAAPERETVQKMGEMG